MAEYDLVQKEADPLNVNLIDLVCPQRRESAKKSGVKPPCALAPAFVVAT
jgi:hypothetical protein